MVAGGCIERTLWNHCFSSIRGRGVAVGQGLSLILTVSFVVLFVGPGVPQLGVKVVYYLLLRTLRARRVIVSSYYLAEHILDIVEYGKACF